MHVFLVGNRLRRSTSLPETEVDAWVSSGISTALLLYGGPLYCDCVLRVVPGSVQTSWTACIAVTYI
jgi:hypothetical protein